VDGPIIVQMINVAFDAKRFFQNSTGLGNYSRTLIINLNKYHSRLFKLFLFSPVSSKNSASLSEKYSITTVYPLWYQRFFWRIFGVPKDCKKHLELISFAYNQIDQLGTGLFKGFKKLQNISSLFQENFPIFRQHLYVVSY
jgi:hypothetical protein